MSIYGLNTKQHVSKKGKKCFEKSSLILKKKTLTTLPSPPFFLFVFSKLIWILLSIFFSNRQGPPLSISLACPLLRTTPYPSFVDKIPFILNWPFHIQCYYLVFLPTDIKYKVLQVEENLIREYMTKTGRLSIILTDFEIIKLWTPTYNLFFYDSQNKYFKTWHYTSFSWDLVDKMWWQIPLNMASNLLTHKWTKMMILHQAVVPTRRYCTLSPSPVLLAASLVTGDLSSYGSPAAPALRYLLAIR